MLNGPAAAQKRFAFNLEFSDTGKKYLLVVENAVFHGFENRQAPDPDAKLTMSVDDFKLMMFGFAKAADLIEEDKLALKGDVTALVEFNALFDQFNVFFPIVTPRPQGD